MPRNLLTGIGPGIRVSPSLSMVSLGLSRFAGDIRSVRPLLEEIVREIVIPRVESNFETESAAGNRWQKLSTRAVQDRGGSANPILQRTGKLRREATQFNIWTFDGQQGFAFVRGSAFTRSPSAMFHQEGTSKMPQREFLVINETDVNNIQNKISEWWQERAGARIGGIANAVVVGRNLV